MQTGRVMRYRGPVPLAMALVTCLVLGACAGSDGGVGDRVEGSAGSAAAVVANMPDIYVDSSVEFFSRDVNLAREGYLRNLEVCRQSDLPVRELSADEVARLGTGRLQRWYRSDSFAYRWEQWGFHTVGGDRSGLCQFGVTTTGAHHYITADTHRAVALKTGEAFSDPEGYRFYFPRKPVDNSSDLAALQAQARNASRVPARDRRVAGQPCEHFSVDHVDTCEWSGGRAWGFDPGPRGLDTNSVRSLSNGITLEQEPAKGSGMRVTTRSFQVGASFDEADMLPRKAE